MSAILTRSATANDVTALLALDPSQTREWIEAALAKQKTGQSTFVVSYQGQKITGQVVLDWQAFPVLELSDLLVHPEHRRQGIGRQLIQTAEEKAWVGKFTQIKIVSNADLNCAERKLYAKLGYEVDSSQSPREIETRFGTLAVVTLIKNI